MSDPIVESVIEKLRSRSVRGLDKYGVGLDREDLSVVEWLTHLQEELLDAAGYVEKLIQMLGGRKSNACRKEPPFVIPKEVLKRMQEEKDARPPRPGGWDFDPKPTLYGPPPPTIPKTTFDRDAIIYGREDKP